MLKRLTSLIIICSTLSCAKSTINIDFEAPHYANSAVNIAFIQHGLDKAEALYGKARIAPQHIRISHNANQAYTYQHAEAGTFTLYLTRKQHEYAFHGQLAHEIAHLLNAHLFDAYVEGLNMVFAELLLKEHNLDWRGWQQHFEQNGDPFYAATYFMMKDVSQAAGKDAMKTFLSFARYENNPSSRMYIDINAWLSSLSPQKQQAIKAIIRHHADAVYESMHSTVQKNHFEQPL